jgi:hypothetical protein
MWVKTEKGGQSFLHLLISKGNNAALYEVLTVLQQRMQSVDLKRLLNLRNAWTGQGLNVVDTGFRSRNLTGVNIARSFGGTSETPPPAKIEKKQPNRG